MAFKNIKINYTVLAVISAGFLATSGDITMTWTSPVYPKLYSNDTSENPIGRPITDNEDGWIGSLINIGAIVGPIPFSYIAEKFGRKIGLLSIAIPHITAYVTFAFSKNVYLFYFGRVFGGMALGGGYTLLPMYIAEISEDSNRGLLSVSLIVFWCTGNLLPYVLGPFMSIMLFNLVLLVFPVTFLVLFVLFGVETPYYWLKMNQPENAEKSLMRLRSLDKSEIGPEMNHIQNNMNREADGHLSDIIKSRPLRKALIISMLLVIFQQLSGVNAITFYLQPIYDASCTKIPSEISSIISGVAIFISSFSPPLLVDRFGRRTLTMASCIGMIFPLIFLGGYFYVHDYTNQEILHCIFWVPVTSFVVFAFAYSSGIGILPWTISSELFPTNVKQISASTVSCTCWITSFLVTKFFNNMKELLGAAGTFWFYASCCFVALIFTFFFVPETKGKSFREIQDMLEA